MCWGWSVQASVSLADSRPGRVARWVFRGSVAVSGGRVGSGVLPGGVVGWVGTVDVVDRSGSQSSGSWAPLGVDGRWWEEVDANVVRTENVVLEEA